MDHFPRTLTLIILIFPINYFSGGAYRKIPENPFPHRTTNSWADQYEIKKQNLCSSVPTQLGVTMMYSGYELIIPNAYLSKQFYL